MFGNGDGQMVGWAVLARVEQKLCKAERLELGTLRVLVRVAALAEAGIVVRSKEMVRVTRASTWHAARVQLVARGWLGKHGIPGTGGRGRCWVLTEAGRGAVVRLRLALAQAERVFLRGAD